MKKFKTNILPLLFVMSMCFACNNDSERIDLYSEDFIKLKTILEKGIWAWGDEYCDASSQTIRFNMDEKTMILTLQNATPVDGKEKSIYVYDIKWAWKRGLRGKIRGENLLDAEGQQVEWDLFVVDKNSFYWRRSDWHKNAASKPIINCKSREK